MADTTSKVAEILEIILNRNGLVGFLLVVIVGFTLWQNHHFANEVDELFRAQVAAQTRRIELEEEAIEARTKLTYLLEELIRQRREFDPTWPEP